VVEERLVILGEVPLIAIEDREEVLPTSQSDATPAYSSGE
jgi:hypothetical protein